MNLKIVVVVFTLYFSFKGITNAQKMDHSWEKIALSNDTAWFSTSEAREIAENVLLYQRNIGGWPKNIGMYKPISEKEKQDLMKLKESPDDCTIDNGATYLEMHFLSRMYSKVKDERYKAAFIKGLEYLFMAQYENGGWPQYYPLQKGYYGHITYNDDAMVHILKIMKEIGSASGYFAIKPESETVEKAKMSFEKGISCILKTQYRQNDTLTAWCAQHDENTLLPAKARAYELPSLSGKESAQIVLLLMSIDKPSDEIVSCIEYAVKWFEKTKISGIREVKKYDAAGKIVEKTIEKDPNAPPIWARFMELENNRPFFCDRDGIKKYALSEIGIERRTGYAWYTDEPEEVLKKYPKWKKKIQNNSKANQYNGINTPLTGIIIVSKDGTGDFESLQSAINACKSFSYERITIKLKKGKYTEKIKVPEWITNLTIEGESRKETIISWDDYFGKMNMGPNSTFYTPTVLVEGDDFTARNLTIVNSAGEVGQAVALSVKANRVFIENCDILGNQDTFYTSGDSARQYLKNCYIEGTTDFIFGRGTVLFDSCIIHSKKNSYITAASTSKEVPFGLVFINCNFTASDNVDSVYLGRPWRIYAKTVIIKCRLGEHIRPEGWHNWSKPEAEKTCYYAEFENTGQGADIKKRVRWSHQLSRKETEKYTLKNILGEGKWYQSTEF
ncbi:MAG: pectate lyase [Bacteroidales bacterium]